MVLGVLRPFEGGPVRGDAAARAVAPFEIAEAGVGLCLEDGIFEVPTIDAGLRAGVRAAGVAIKAKDTQDVIVTIRHTTRSATKHASCQAEPSHDVRD